MVITHSRWFRLLVTCAMDKMTETGKGQQQVLFMLDEFPVLGHLSCIERAVGAARGSGVQLWPFLQDLSQLEDNYGKRASSFFGNSGIQQYFTPNDMETAKHLALRCGEVTHIASGANYGQNVSFNESERRKPLFSAHALHGMPENKQLLFIAGNQHPLYVAKLPYYNNPKYKGRYDKNPYLRD